MKIIFYFLLIALLCSCNKKAKDSKFDKGKWLIKEDIEYPYREDMLNDLVSNYKLKGLSYKQIINLIGEPQPDDKSYNQLFYDISVDFGMDIDPIYAKTLVIEFTNDSIVSGYRIDEYKNE